MNCDDIKLLFDDYIDGGLPEEGRRAVEKHTASCDRCRDELSEYNELVSLTRGLEESIDPSRDLWPGIETRLYPQRVLPAFGRTDIRKETGESGLLSQPLRSTTRKRSFLRYRLIPAAAIVLLAVAVLFIAGNRSGGWSVSTVDGAPTIGTRFVTDSGTMRAGDWLETDDRARARLNVGLIGQVDINPNSRLRILNTRLTEHRIELSRGSIHALIWAPPRIFFVETPSATAIDLGCEYTLTVDDHGNSELHVLSGWVALELHGRETVVPAGVMCYSRSGIGPGTPFRRDASPRLIDALEKFDFESGGQEDLQTVLDEAEQDDAITLWHLLIRSDDGPRLVYDRLAQLITVPDHIDREKILRRDEKELEALQRHLKLTAKKFRWF